MSMKATRGLAAFRAACRASFRWRDKWLASSAPSLMLLAVILCASDLAAGAGRQAAGDAVSAVVRVAGDAGFDGIAVDASWLAPDLAPLLAAASAVGLAVPVVASPLAEARLAPGRRLPYLAALEDGDERRAALAAFTATLEAAVTLGARTLTVALGEISLGVSAPTLARRFARGELAEGEGGAVLGAAVLRERRGRSARVLDACRAAVDRILPLAERRGVALAIEIAAHPWALPGPREAGQLVDEYRDGPIGVVWDPARLQVLAQLSAAPATDVQDRLRAAARVWRANEAVGVDSGYLPGLGDPDGAPPDGEMPAARPIIVAGRPDSSRTEIAAARERLAARPAA